MTNHNIWTKNAWLGHVSLAPLHQKASSVSTADGQRLMALVQSWKPRLFAGGEDEDLNGSTSTYPSASL